MRKRSKAREYALQILYQMDIRHSHSAQVIHEFWENHDSPPAEIRSFADQLVEGTMEHLGEIDPVITRYASNWSLKRMGMVDRNIIRLGTFELMWLKEVPPKVSLNEAVELAKRYGDADSSKFVNGVLDAIHKSLKPHDAPQPPAA